MQLFFLSVGRRHVECVHTHTQILWNRDASVSVSEDEQENKTQEENDDDDDV